MTQQSTNSSNIDIFTQNKNDWEIALKNGGYKTNLIYKTRNECSDKQNGKSNHKRGILWFNPPFNMYLANNIVKDFFKILWNNFSPTSTLYKIFNKNNIKLSYSCMPNVGNLINKSNKKTYE